MRTLFSLFVLVPVVVLAIEPAAAEPLPPLPAPVVPEVLERRLRVESAGGFEIAPGARVVARLNDRFALGLSAEDVERLGAELDVGLLAEIGRVTADVGAFLREANKRLGLGVAANDLAVLAEEEKDLLRMPYEDCVRPSRPLEERSAVDVIARTSEDLSGSTLVLAVLVAGPDESDWDNGAPWYDISTACGKAGDAMGFYEGRAPGQASITHEVRYYTTSVSSKPKDDEDCNRNWMDEAFQNLGFTDDDGDGTYTDEVTLYVRSLFGTDNCVIVFVPKESGRAYACRGLIGGSDGPHCVVYYFSYGIFYTGYETYAHELGHLFGACDEYYQWWDNTGCADNDPDNEAGEWCDDPCDITLRDFQPWYLNGNCEACNSSSVDCMMKANSTSICTHTKGQFGWRDHDGDGFIDAVDRNPAVAGPECSGGAPDVSRPISSVTALPERTTGNTTFTVSWSAVDGCGAIAAYDVQVRDGTGAWTDWKTGVAATSASWVGADFHTYYFRSRARDEYGNEEAWPSGHDTYTTVMVGAPPAPAVTSTTHPDPEAWNGGNDPRFAWTITVPSDLSIGQIIATYSWDVDRWASTVPDDASEGPERSAAFTNLADGTWYFHVKAKDWSGTWSATTHRKFRIDTSAPPAPVVASGTHPYSNRWYSGGQAAFTWTRPADPSGITGYSIRGPDEDPLALPDESVDVTDSTWTTTFSGSDSGTLWFHVRAMDNLFHWGPAAHYRLHMDRTPPGLPNVSSSTHPAAATWYATNDPAFSWTIPGDSSGIGGYSWMESATYLDLPDTTSEGINPATFFTDVSDGQRYFHLRVRDAAVPPNWSSGARHTTFRSDTVPPGLVQGLGSGSHSHAIGQWNNPQSADNTVQAGWEAAVDPAPSGGLGGYSYVWDHQPVTLPDAAADVPATTTSVTSTPLADATDWYFHVRSVDQPGNWDDAAAHLGPFYINTAPPSVPSGLWAAAGNSRVDLDWNDNPGDPDFAGFMVYRRTMPWGGYLPLNAAPIFQSAYTDLAVENGVDYGYVVAALDSIGNESDFSAERRAMPEYATPGTGTLYTLSDLVTISNHGVTGWGTNFYLNGTVTISAGDSLLIRPGETLHSSDLSGTKKLLVRGDLRAKGTIAGGTVRLTAQGGFAGAWGGIELLNPGAYSLIDSCTIEHADNAVAWFGAGARIGHNTIRRNRGTAVYVHALSGAPGDVSLNAITDNGGDGIRVFADSAATVIVAENAVTRNGGDGVSYALAGAWPSGGLNILDNDVRGNTGEGIRCGQGGAATLIQGNDVRENRNGIYMDGETWGARPVIQFNNVQGNRAAGIHCANMAAPRLTSNTVVGNMVYGVRCRTQAEPILTSNTITGSRYGVYIDEYTGWPTPDLGSGPNASGGNAIHGHSVYSVYTTAPDSVRAHGNWWGIATTMEMAMFQPPALGNVTAFWDFWDWVPPGAPPGMIMYEGWLNLGTTPPSLTVDEPSTPAVVDSSFVIRWTDFDVEENAQINLYFDDDGSGLDGTIVEGGAGLNEDSPVDTLVWNVVNVPAGTYHVYGIIDDGWTSISAYSVSQVTVDHPDLVVEPDTLRATMPANAVREDTLVVRNLSSHYALRFTAAAVDSAGAGVDWVAVAPDSGVLASGGTDSTMLVVTCDTEGFTAGPYRAWIRIVSDDPADSILAVPLEIEVAYPVAVLADAALAFGPVERGSGVDDSITVRNAGTAALTLSGATSTHAGFSVPSPSFPATVGIGDSVAVVVRFAPVGPDSASGTITFATDDPYDPDLVAIATGFGLEPDIALSAAGHDFGSLVHRATAGWMFAIYNTGNDSLIVSGITPDLPDWTITDPEFPDTLAPGDTTWVGVAFTADTMGTRSGALTVASDDPDEASLDVDVAAVVLKPEVAVSAADHDYGTVRVDAPAPWSFRVRNSGTAPLRLFDAAGENPDFALLEPAFPETLAAGDSVVVTVAFTPFASGASEDTLRVASDDAETPVVAIAVRGEGGNPALAVADSTHAFGAVRVGTAAEWVLRVRNEGTTPLTVDSLVVDAGPFTAPGTWPAAVAAGDSADLVLRFEPAEIGSANATAALHSDDIARPLVWIALDGSGVVPDLDLAATAHSFGDVRLGTYADWPLIARNRGGHPLILRSAAVGDTLFAVLAPAFPCTVAAGDSAAITVRFTPVGEELASDALVLRTDDPADSVRAITLAGSGAWPDLLVQPAAFDEIVFEGEMGERVLELANVGTGPLPFMLAETDSLANPADPPWLALTPLADTLATGRHVPVTLALDADVIGTGFRQAGIRIESSDPDTPLVQVPITVRVPRMRFADHRTESATFTVSDEGCYGFFDLVHHVANGHGIYGSGFRYRGTESALFHGSLWAGVDAGHVADGTYEYDWTVAPGGGLSFGLAGQVARATFTDAGAPSPMGLRVSQRSIGFLRPPDDDFVRLEYTLVNAGAAPLSGLYAGLWLDWDVAGVWGDVGGYDPARALGWQREGTAPGGVHYGVCLLEPSAPASFRFIDNPAVVYPTFNVPDGVKYALLSSGVRDSATVKATDWSTVMASGPYSLAPGDSVTVAFAVVAGENLADLRANAERARARYPVGITLAWLDARVTDAGVELTWAAESVAGCVLLRSEGEAGEFAPLGGAGSCCRFVDRAIEAGRVYSYRLDAGGETLAGPITVEVPAPRMAHLGASWPNPFSARTSIALDLPREAPVRITVFDLAGRVLRQVHDGPVPGGRTVFTWDGADATGRRVASGLYFCLVEVEGRRFTRKMTLLR